MRAVLWSFFVLIFALSTTAQSLTGRWVRTGALGVYDIDSSGYVMSLTPLIDEWQVAIIELNLTSNTVVLHIPSKNISGQVLDQGTTIIYPSVGVSWHKYGENVMCVNPTKRRSTQDTSATPQNGQSKFQIEFLKERERYKELNISVDNLEYDPANITKVHLVISTHFDLGYTDYAWCIVQHYFWYIYPGIIDTALALPNFKYSTYSWLLYLHFNCDRLLPYIKPPSGLDFVCPIQPMQDALANAIQKGQIVFSAYPFDGFNEMLGSILFDFAFDFSQWLELKFGLPVHQTMAQIDVPGIYSPQLNALLRNDIKGLYVGQNFAPLWAGSIPLLPNLFRWTAPDKSGDIVVMTHKGGYGGITAADAIVDPVTMEALVVQCVLENSVPYTPQDVLNYVNQVQRHFPNSQVVISTYDDFVNQLLPHKNVLPVYDKNMGDTWVRAVPSDPVKTQTFLTLRRAFERCVNSGNCTHRTEIQDQVLFLMTGCEHNWGLPVYPDNPEACTLSNQEKRDFLQSVIEYSKKNVPALYEAIIDEQQKLKPVELPKNQEDFVFKAGSKIPTYECGNIVVGFGPTGAVNQLTDTSTGIQVAGNQNLLGAVEYTSYNIAGVKHQPDTTGGDPMQKYLNFSAIPVLQYLVVGPRIGNLCSFSSVSYVVQDYKGLDLPITVTVTINIDATTLAATTFQLDFTGVSLSFYRLQTYSQDIEVGDGMSIQFNPILPVQDKDWMVTTLDVTYSPKDFFPNGTTHYHIGDHVSTSNGFINFTSLDAPLIMFGNASSVSWFEDFNKIEFLSGVWVNLWNSWNWNWVVGFPWKDEDREISFRFSLAVNS